MAKQVTIYDVAKRAGMSVASISYALNGRTDMISERTNRKIHRLAEEMGYRPSRQARQLRHRASRTLAIQVDSSVTSSNTWRSSLALSLLLVNGVGAYAASRGYNINLLIPEQAQLLEDVQRQIIDENSVDGVIFLGYRALAPRELARLVQSLNEARIPAVTIAESFSQLGIPTVAVNLKPAVEQAVQRLAEVGCRRAAYVGLMHHAAHERVGRFSLFRDALQKAEIELPARSVIRTLREIDGYRHTIELLDRGPLPDCIIYGSDHVAMAGLQALLDRGIRVPDDVRILGVDHAPYAIHSPVELASLDQRFFERGRLLAEVLIKQIQKGFSSVPMRTELDAVFVEGASIGTAHRNPVIKSRIERREVICQEKR